PGRPGALQLRGPRHVQPQQRFVQRVRPVVVPERDGVWLARRRVVLEGDVARGADGARAQDGDVVIHGDVRVEVHLVRTELVVGEVQVVTGTDPQRAVPAQPDDLVLFVRVGGPQLEVLLPERLSHPLHRAY